MQMDARKEKDVCLLDSMANVAGLPLVRNGTATSLRFCFGLL